MDHSYHFQVGPGLILAPLRYEHLALTLAWRNHEDTRNMFRNSQYISEDVHKLWFASYLLNSSDIMFILLDRGNPVGQLGIYNINHSLKSAEVGRFISSMAIRGSGKMQNAIQSLIAFCDKTLLLIELSLEVKETNHVAIHIYQKTGFRQAGTSADGFLLMERSFS